MAAASPRRRCRPGGEAALRQGLFVLLAWLCAATAWAQPLPSWNEGLARARILAVLRRLPNLFEFVDDGPGKPVGIYRAIGQRPLAAFGNSDGDLQMLQYTAAGSGPRLALLVRHTDEVREWAYDRKSRIGRLDKALDEAERKGWTVVDMKKDWKRVYAFEP
jgi:hypothetical protein